MNAQALLNVHLLIGELYGQVAAANEKATAQEARIAQLEAELAASTKAEPA
jgi:hypothetical protein